MEATTYPPNSAEIWKPVKGYELTYEVSNQGRIRSLDRLTNFGSQKKFIIGRVLKIKYRKNKYPSVIFSQDNIQDTQMIHRIVAENLIPNPENYGCVNHINGIKTDNRVENLEWCTYKQNVAHAMKTGLYRNTTREWFNADESRKKKVSDRFRGEKNHMFQKFSEQEINRMVELRKTGIALTAITQKINNEFGLKLLSAQGVKRILKDSLPNSKTLQKGGHKINQEQVKEIRAKYVLYKCTADTLAKEYGLSQSMVSNIISFRSWKNVV